MNNKAHLRPNDYDRNGDIIPDSVREDKGDLISRSALKEDIQKCKNEPNYQHEGEDWRNGLCIAEDLIDNAPTVEPEKVLIANVTFDEEKLKELTDEIVERIKSGEIVLQDERPKCDKDEYNCFHCKYASKPAYEEPCNKCKHSYDNKFEWDMRGEDNG